MKRLPLVFPKGKHRAAGPVRKPLFVLGVLSGLAATLVGCSDPSPTATQPMEPEDRIARLEWVSGTDQSLVAGRRSPEPFRVLAVDDGGHPVEGAEVGFGIAGTGAVLSQPVALTDSAGVAETYLMDTRSGEAVLTARAGRGEASAPLSVARAPGELVFEEGTGSAGLPGKSHPDSVVRVRVLDLEGRPMEGAQVWFAGPPELSRYVDTTDADGWASTRIRRSQMAAGEAWVWAFMLGFPDVIARAPRHLRAAAERVVLVTIDGLRADALERWAPPTLLDLAARGASTTRARTVVPTLTTPTHLSLLSGVPPSEHGVFGDELTYTEEMGNLDPLFRLAANRGHEARAFMSSSGPLRAFEEAFRCKAAFGLDSLELVPGWGADVVTAAAPAVADGEIHLVFVHIPDPDVAGHAHGWESPAYGDAVLAADSAVARVLEGLGPEALVVVTSGHGGGGAYGSFQHGSDADEDVLIPLILAGPGVVAGFDLGQASILDVAPTALWALGLQPPFGYRGRVHLQAFTNR